MSLTLWPLSASTLESLTYHDVLPWPWKTWFGETQWSHSRVFLPGCQALQESCPHQRPTAIPDQLTWEPSVFLSPSLSIPCHTADDMLSFPDFYALHPTSSLSFDDAGIYFTELKAIQGTAPYFFLFLSFYVCSFLSSWQRSTLPPVPGRSFVLCIPLPLSVLYSFPLFLCF